MMLSTTISVGRSLSARNASKAAPSAARSLASATWRTAAPGDEVVVPPGVRHSYRNDGDEPAGRHPAPAAHTAATVERTRR